MIAFSYQLFVDISLGVVLGGFMSYLVGSNAMLRLKYRAAKTMTDNLAQKLTEAEETAAKYSAHLQEARDIFAEQLKRPVVAYFDDKQVHSLAQMLVQQLFVPAAQAVRREIDEKKKV